MLAYYGSHILHSAIAYFGLVPVEKGVILVLLREVFRYELKEGFADVSFHDAVKRRIIPDNVTLAVSTWSIILSVFVVGKACCVSTRFEGVVISSLSFVEFFFVAREQTSQMSQLIWWMIKSAPIICIFYLNSYVFFMLSKTR